MTSFLDVIAADESDRNLAGRKAVIAAKKRVQDQYGAFIAAHGFETALDYLEADINSVTSAACEEFGYDDVDGVVATVIRSYTPVESNEKVASVHESRKPKMCPFHKDVVDISLTAGDPQAGYNSMTQHWGGPRHCEGDGYEGSKCNFKPQMTTQSYWDDKAEQAEQRKHERELQREQEALPVDSIDTDVDLDSEIVENPVEPETTEVIEDGAEVIPFPTQESAPVEEVPMSMAASKEATETTGLGSPSPTIDKRKWTPSTVPFLDVDDSKGPHPTKHQDIVGEKPDNSDKLSDIGEQVTERQSLPSSDNAGFSDGGEDKGEHTKTFPKGNQADPVTSAKLPNDVDKNPITAIIQGDYDGFLPHAEVQQAIEASRRS